MEDAFASAQEGLSARQTQISEHVGLPTRDRQHQDAADALSEYHIARVNVQRLTGTTINTLSTVEMKQE